MKRLVPTIAIVAFLILPVFLTLPAEGQELWGGAKAGMTLTEVRNAFPNTVPDEKNKLKNMMFLQAPVITIQGNPYTPVFILKDEKLIVVRLRFNGKRLPFSIALRHIYTPTLGALRAKYGAEASQSSKHSGAILIQKHTWYSGARIIELDLMDIGSGAFFEINYKAAATGDLDKL